MRVGGIFKWPQFVYTYTYGKKNWVWVGLEGGRGGAHQPRKRTLVPEGWEGRLLRRRRMEGRGWVEEDMIYLYEGREDERDSGDINKKST